MRSFLFLVLFFFFSVRPVFAHLPGQPPFFTLNAEFSDYYPITTDYSSKDFVIPQDIAPKQYLINEPISFEIHKYLLPFPPEISENAIFSWDFGDGTKAEGTANTHAYTKPGTYELIISADFGEKGSDIPSEIQRMAITIIPDNGFQIPVAAVSANGKSIIPPTTYIEADLSKKVTLSAQILGSGSQGGITYLWNLDNGETAQGQTVTAEYPNNPYLVSPIVRTVTNDGFITDTQVTIKNTHFGEKALPIPMIAAGVCLLLIIIAGIMILLLKRKRKTKIRH